uniref:Uncharacterized protein n=1 Tax=Cannabis sativa TaxID=3483 RepID=A0A803PDS5_CANSA
MIGRGKWVKSARSREGGYRIQALKEEIDKEKKSLSQVNPNTTLGERISALETTRKHRRGFKGMDGKGNFKLLLRPGG